MNGYILTPPQQQDADTSLNLAIGVSVDYFIIRHLSVGLGSTLTYAGSHSATISDTTWIWSVAPRVGYVVPLSEDVCLWPRLDLAVNENWSSQAGGTANGAAHSNGLGAGLSVPVMVQLAPHVLWGVGPAVAVTSTTYQTNELGALAPTPSKVWNVTLSSMLDVYF